MARHSLVVALVVAALMEALAVTWLVLRVETLLVKFQEVFCLRNW